MVSVVVATRAALLIARRGFTWAVEQHLRGRSSECVAVDPRHPARVYCGTAGAGLFRSRGGGRQWASVAPGIDHLAITAVAVGHADQGDGFGVVFAGTEPSAVFRSETGGDSWVDLAGLRALPSAATWSFPPRPHTHHVRWIEADVSAAERVWRTGLEQWEQAMSGLPKARGTTASRFATHASEPGVIYAANNRGLFRSDDAGRSWKALDIPWPERGLADGVEAIACLPE